MKQVAHVIANIPRTNTAAFFFIGFSFRYDDWFTWTANPNGLLAWGFAYLRIG